MKTLFVLATLLLCSSIYMSFQTPQFVLGKGDVILLSSEDFIDSDSFKEDVFTLVKNHELRAREVNNGINKVDSLNSIHVLTNENSTSEIILDRLAKNRENEKLSRKEYIMLFIIGICLIIISLYILINIYKRESEFPRDEEFGKTSKEKNINSEVYNN